MRKHEVTPAFLESMKEGDLFVGTITRIGNDWCEACSDCRSVHASCDADCSASDVPASSSLRSEHAAAGGAFRSDCIPLNQK